MQALSGGGVSKRCFYHIGMVAYLRKHDSFQCLILLILLLGLLLFLSLM
jgi:hypothetical protein